MKFPKEGSTFQGLGSKVVMIIILVALFLSPVTLNPVLLHADDNQCDPSRFSDPNDPALLKCMADFNKSLQLSINATKPLEGQLESLKRQLNALRASLQNIAAGIAQKEIDLKVREDKLVEENVLLASRVRSYYINSYLNDPLTIILSHSGSGDMLRDLAYRQAATAEDQRVITQITADMIDLLNQKDQLEKDKAATAALQAEVDKNATFLDGEIKKAKVYQADLTNQIAQLSAKQQELLAEKLGSLNIPLYAYSTKGGCSSDISPYKDPGFGGTKFALFTYGVPNRVGLNQYGAWGRAKAGQSSDTILHAYYNFDSYQNMSATIKVNDGNGYNTGNVIWTGSLEDYVKRIWEVPDSWTDNDLAALKAQAIAARSFVMAETGNGAMSICATQSCQVFQTNPKGGNWDVAVNATAGQVMVQGGQPITAWFSSTHGGYIYSSADIGWKSTSFTKRGQDSNSSVGSFSDLQSKAYDKDSPWFYCDWGGRSADNGTAWLKPEELADIVNVLMLAKADSSTQEHLSQVDKPNPDGVDTWDADRVKQELRSRGITPFNSISDGLVSADFGNGITTNVSFSGDGGSQSFSGSDFKNYFNLRAPSNINIVGPLYNIEKR